MYTSPICLAIVFFLQKKILNSIGKSQNRIIGFKNQNCLGHHLRCETNTSKQKINDFEDGLDSYSALESKCEVLITEDLNVFYFSEIEISDCKTFFKKIAQT